MHVGMPKAGSTAIQQSLCGFDDNRTRYAALGPSCHSQRIMAAFCANPRSNQFLARRARRDVDHERVRDRTLALLQREIALDRDALIVSGEAIGGLRIGDIAAMDHFFAARACKLTVIVYVREPVGFASSSFQQRVRGGNANFDIRASRPSYRRRYQDWIDALGPGRIKFCDFRREKLTGRSVVADFSSFVGIDPANVTERRAHESLSAEATALLYFWNRERPRETWSRDAGHATRLMTVALAKTFKGRFRLSRSLVRKIAVDDDIAWMEQTGGFPLRFELDAPEDDDSPTIGSEADVRRTCTAALPQLRALLEALGVEPPRQRAAYPLMASLYEYFGQKVKCGENERGFLHRHGIDGVNGQPSSL